MTETALPDERLEMRQAILAAALPHIAFDGWSSTALSRGAKDAGYDDIAAARVFPGGARELLSFHLEEADRRLLAALAETDLAAMRIRDRIAFAVRLRLEHHAAEREAVRRGLLFLAQPQHSALALRALYRTVDAIWYAAGDTSTDFNFYTKRGLLAGVYSSTLLFWLSDNSADNAATWAFLERRIADVMKVSKLSARLRKTASALPDPLRLFRLVSARV